MKSTSARKRIQTKRGFNAGECITESGVDESADEFFEVLSDVAHAIRGDLRLVQPDKTVARWLIVAND